MHDLFDREIRRRPATVIAELEQAVEANPLHEGFAAQLMTAQYRAGRQADALRTYQALRRRLGDELGLEPGPAIRELEGRILRHELTVVRAVARRRPRAPAAAGHRGVDRADRRGRPAGRAALDPEDELALAAPLRRAARARIVERGGVVLADAGDGLSACFGYPSTERSVERAVLRRARRSATWPRRRRAGVRRAHRRRHRRRRHRGPGRRQRRRAHRHRRRAAAGGRRGCAQRPAPGEVLLGPATAAARRPTSSSSSACDRRRRRSPWRSRTAGRAATLAPVCVGREAAAVGAGELWRGRSTTASARSPSTGPAGIGKSALVDPSSRSSARPWSAVRAALRSDATARRRCTRSGPCCPSCSTWSRAVGPAVVAALRRALGRPQPVLVVEDVDAADPSTLEVLDDAARPAGQRARPADQPGARARSSSAATSSPGSSSVPLDRAAWPGAWRRRSPATGACGSTPSTRSPTGPAGSRCYVEALTRAVLDALVPGRPAVPRPLYDSLMADLDRLGPARAAGPAAARCSAPTFDETDLESDRRRERRCRAGHRRHGGGPRRAGRRGHGRTASPRAVADAAYESLLNADRLALHAAIADAMSRPARPRRTGAPRLPPRGSRPTLRCRGRLAPGERRRDPPGPPPRGAAPRPSGPRSPRFRSTPCCPTAATPGAVPCQPRRRRCRRRATARPSCCEVIDRGRASGVGGDDLAARRRARTSSTSATSTASRRLRRAPTRGRRGDPSTPPSAGRRAVGGVRPAVPRGHRWSGGASSTAGSPSSSSAARTGMADGGPRPDAPPGPFGALWSLLGLAAYFADRPRDAPSLLARARAMIPDDDGYGRCLVGGHGGDGRPARRPRRRRARGRRAGVVAGDGPRQRLLVRAGPRRCSAGRSPPTSGDDRAGDDGRDASTMARRRRRRSRTSPTCSASRLCEHGRTERGHGAARGGPGRRSSETGERLWVPLLHADEGPVARRCRAIGTRRRPGVDEAATLGGTTMGAAPDRALARRVARGVRGMTGHGGGVDRRRARPLAHRRRRAGRPGRRRVLRRPSTALDQQR